MTNRLNLPFSDIDNSIIRSLSDCTERAGYHFSALTQRGLLDELGAIIGDMDRMRFIHPEGHHSLFNKEVRWSHKAAKQARDGLDISSFDISSAQITGMKIASNKTVMSLMNRFGATKSFSKMSRKAVDNAPAVGLIWADEFSRESYVNGGRAMERVWLKATELGYSLQPLMSPVLFFMEILHGNKCMWSDDLLQEMLALRSSYKKLFSIDDSAAEICLFRLVPKSEKAIKSFRRASEDVLEVIES